MHKGPLNQGSFKVSNKRKVALVASYELIVNATYGKCLQRQATKHYCGVMMNRLECRMETNSATQVMSVIFKGAAFEKKSTLLTAWR